MILILSVLPLDSSLWSIPVLKKILVVTIQVVINIIPFRIIIIFIIITVELKLLSKHVAPDPFQGTSIRGAGPKAMTDIDLFLKLHFVIYRIFGRS